MPAHPTAVVPPGEPPTLRHFVFAVVGAAFVLRVVFAARVELLPEEAYYWNYSRHLDIGYLDHPPMVAWLIRIGTTCFGNTEFGVRFGALCCGAATGFFVYRLTHRMFGAQSALAALAMTQTLPYFFLSGMLMTPDAPLCAAWSAALYFLEGALRFGGWRNWLLGGATLGLGLLSKYTIALLGAAVALFILVDPPARRWVRRYEPYGALLLSAAIFTPVIVWNAEHEWASFAFQTSRRLAEVPRFSLHKLAAAMIVLLTPVGFGALLVAWLRGLPRELTPIERTAALRPWRLMHVALLVPLAVFALFSLRHEVKLDWTGALSLAAVPMLAMRFAVARRKTGGRSHTSPWPATFVALLVLYGAGFYHLSVGIPGIGYSSRIELLPVGWRDFGREVDALAVDARGRYGADLLVVGMDRYALASERAFYSAEQNAAVAATSSWHLFGGMGLMYERWFPADRQVGRPLLLVSLDARDLDAANLESRVRTLEPLQEGRLERDGRLVRPYYHRVVLGFRSERAREEQERVRSTENRGNMGS